MTNNSLTIAKDWNLIKFNSTLTRHLTNLEDNAHWLYNFTIEDNNIKIKEEKTFAYVISLNRFLGLDLAFGDVNNNKNLKFIEASGDIEAGSMFNSIHDFEMDNNHIETYGNAMIHITLSS